MAWHGGAVQIVRASLGFGVAGPSRHGQLRRANGWGSAFSACRGAVRRRIRIQRASHLICRLGTRNMAAPLPPCQPPPSPSPPPRPFPLVSMRVGERARGLMRAAFDVCVATTLPRGDSRPEAALLPCSLPAPPPSSPFSLTDSELRPPPVPRRAFGLSPFSSQIGPFALRELQPGLSLVVTRKPRLRGLMQGSKAKRQPLDTPTPAPISDGVGERLRVVPMPMVRGAARTVPAFVRSSEAESLPRSCGHPSLWRCTRVRASPSTARARR